MGEAMMGMMGKGVDMGMGMGMGMGMVGMGKGYGKGGSTCKGKGMGRGKGKMCGKASAAGTFPSAPVQIETTGSASEWSAGSDGPGGEPVAAKRRGPIVV